MRNLILVVAIVVAGSAPAAAQTCFGRASFAVAPFQVSGGAAFTDGANGFEAGFGGGGERLFAGATLGRTNYTGLDESSTDVGGFLGGGPVMRGGTVHVCGIGGVSYSAGPSVGLIDTHSTTVGAAASIGVVAVDEPSYSVVPAFGAGVSVARLTGRVGSVDETDSETFGTVDLGVGLIFNRRVSVTPRISFPVGRDANDPVFAITLGINFGR